MTYHEDIRSKKIYSKLTTTIETGLLTKPNFNRLNKSCLKKKMFSEDFKKYRFENE